MYRKAEEIPITPENFELPFSVKLSQDNRWVIMASLIPWTEFEAEYAQNFAEEMGAPALPFRVALGSLIIKEKLGTSDRETVEQIKENPYLQYFIGLDEYSNEAPFDPSLLVRFRERINIELIQKINQRMVEKSQSEIESSSKKKEADSAKKETKEQPNKGKLILDATCAPADISYPNDLGLLNKARSKTERISWDNFNESVDFKAAVETFKEARGVYPESVHVDRIYRTRSNRAFCKEKGIRISGPPLGRPPAYVSAEKKRQAQVLGESS